MGLFDRVLGPLSGAVADVSNAAVNYAIAPVRSVISEASAKVNSTFGEFSGRFGKLTTQIPTASLLALQANTISASAVKRELGRVGINDNSHKVKLEFVGDSGFDDFGSFITDTVEFDAMPDVSEVRSAEYEALPVPQMPAQFQKYTGTKSVQWNINATLVARTRSEAARNYRIINALRAWTMPYFGEKQARDKLGAPPPVLMFSGWRTLVGKVPVVLTQLNWTWPKTVDWIPTGLIADGQEIPFPTVMEVQINITETFSAAQFNGFNLAAFRNGDMIGAWSPYQQQIDAPSIAEPNSEQPIYSNEGRNYPAAADYSNEGRNNLDVKVGQILGANANYSNEGRNSIKTVPDYSNEGRNHVRKIQSGGGGDFGGGGSSGSF